jgi:ABC-type sugar transport system ATPase subunit
MGSLRIHGVSRRYGAVVALDDVHLEVADGAFCVVVGPSGCGKSTLLRAVAGLEPVDRGSISIGDVNVTQSTPRDRDVAFVFQSYALYPHMTVRQNLEFPLRARGVAPGDREARVREAAELLRIGDLLDRKPRELSGGQRQRVAIGRAVVRRPRLFLFDEPLSNLDARLRGRMRVELVELHRHLKITSLYVTHDQAEAMTLAENLVVMDRGRIHQEGAPHEVYDRPADLFVADFVGSPSMNFFSGEIDGAPPRQVFRSGGAVLAVTTPLPQGPAVLGVRPEHFLAGEGPFVLDVRLVEDLGADRFVHADGPAGAVVYRAATGEPSPQPGERVGLRPEPGKEHWFIDGRRASP